MRPKQQHGPSTLKSNIVVFVAGVLCGACGFGSLHSPPPAEIVKAPKVTSSMQQLESVPFRKTSHGTSKQQLMEPFSVHPNLAGISVATLQPGQSIERHAHGSMHEFFYVLSGNVDITVESTGKAACPRDCFFHAAPGEVHSFEIAANAPSEMKMIVIGLTTGPKPDR